MARDSGNVVPPTRVKRARQRGRRSPTGSQPPTRHARQERRAVLPVGPFRPASPAQRAKPPPPLTRTARDSGAPASPPGGGLRPAPRPERAAKPRTGNPWSGRRLGAYPPRETVARRHGNAGPSTFLSRGKEGCGRVLGIRWKVPSRGNRDGRWVWASGAGGAGSDFPRTWKTRHHGGGCSPAAAERGAFPTLPTGSP